MDLVQLALVGCIGWCLIEIVRRLAVEWWNSRPNRSDHPYMAHRQRWLKALDGHAPSEPYKLTTIGPVTEADAE